MINGMNIYYDKKVEQGIKSQKAEGLKPILIKNLN